MAQETTASSPQRVAGDAGAPRLGPFRHPVYRNLWIATVAANIGAWMYNAAAGWLMTSLNPAPLMVSLVQVATTLPMFLFALPAGALADIIDKRRFILVLEILSVVTAGLFALLVSLDLVTPAALLAFMFVIGTITAIEAPAWQSVVPLLVPRQDLTSAIAANSVGINISRAVGPALAGVIIGSWSMAAPFSVNVGCNLACVAALWWWRPAPAPAKDLPPESFGNAILVGLRHARYNAPLRATLVRASGFFFFASAYWALLPLLAREQVEGGAGTYGWMLGSIGIGAIIGAFLLPRVKARRGPNWVIAAGSAGTALALLVFAIATRSAVALAAGFLAGISWIAVLATLNVSAQTSLPGWVRGRGLAVYTTVSFGAMTLGSLLWGEFGADFGLPAAHALAASALLITAVALRRRKLQKGSGPDLTPSMYWPLPVLPEHGDKERGPVLVVVDYRIAAADRKQFLDAVQRLGAARKRNGSYRWGVFEDAAEPGHWIETFVVDSWLEYLRELKRVTHADLELVQAVKRFHQGGEPRISRFVA